MYHKPRLLPIHHYSEKEKDNPLDDETNCSHTINSSTNFKEHSTSQQERELSTVLDSIMKIENLDALTEKEINAILVHFSLGHLSYNQMFNQQLISKDLKELL